MPADATGQALDVPSRPAGLFLVFAAAFYDALLCIAMMFAASVAAVAVNGGNAIPPGTVTYDLFLVTVPFPYFGWCWTRAGHTLGMRAWRLRLLRMDGGRLRWHHAVARYLGALLSWAALGLGFAWLLTPARLSWHDRLSGTRVFRED